MINRATVLVGGLSLPESPRWHNGKLWYIDMVGQTLRTVDLDGRSELVETFEHRPSAVDFLPDGSPVVAFRNTKQILRLSDLSLYADLSGIGRRGVSFESVNDMVVDGEGRLYIDCYMPGRDYEQPTIDTGDAIVVVDTDGEPRVAATGTYSPNGLAITPDGQRLIAAEPLLSRLVSYAITDEGALADRTVFATIDGVYPDGICVDSEGAIWSSGLRSTNVIRVHEAGQVTASVDTEAGHYPIAAMLGGPERRHLFITSCHIPQHPTSWQAWKPEDAFIEVAEVDVAGDGWPSN